MASSSCFLGDSRVEWPGSGKIDLPAENRAAGTKTGPAGVLRQAVSCFVRLSLRGETDSGQTRLGFGISTWLRHTQTLLADA